MSKKVLVAGAGGFIGGHVVKQQLAMGHNVVAVDIKPTYEWYQLFDDAINLGRIDLSVDSAADYVTKFKADDIIMLACNMGGMGFIHNHKKECMESVLISTNMARYAVKNGVRRYLYSSSACIYPDYKQSVEKVSLKESDAYPADPEPGYGLEKLFSEEYVRNIGSNVYIPRLHNVYGPCFDDQTEVLTDRGWLFFKDLQDEDKIASRAEDGSMEYLKPIAYQDYEYSGKMHHFLSRSVDQMVTPDHKIFFASNTTDQNGEREVTDFRLGKASANCNRSELFFTSKLAWKGTDPGSTYAIPAYYDTIGRLRRPEQSVPMNAWFSFAGWFISEGSAFIDANNNARVVITQNEGQNYEDICNALDDLNLKYTTRDHTFVEDHNGNVVTITKDACVYNAALCKLVRDQFGVGSENKRIPRWMLEAPVPLLEKLYASLMKGDGDSDGGRYTTKSQRLADDFMELALKLGKTANLSHDGVCYRVSITDRDKFSLRNADYKKENNHKLVNYVGRVYDVTLPRNHVLMVRRNGKACWSGNCGTYDGGREKAPAALCRKVIHAKLSGEGVVDIWGDGEQTRSFMYIDDCLEGFDRLMDSDFHEPLNLGSDELVSINQMVTIIEEIAETTVRREYDLSKPQGVRGRCSDNALIQKTLGWAPSISLQDGLEQTYKWIYDQMCKDYR